MTDNWDSLAGMGVKAVRKTNKLLASFEDVNGFDLVVKIEDQHPLSAARPGL